MVDFQEKPLLWVISLPFKIGEEVGYSVDAPHNDVIVLDKNLRFYFWNFVSRVFFLRFDSCHTCDSTSRDITVTPQCVPDNDYHHGPPRWLSRATILTTP